MKHLLLLFATSNLCLFSKAQYITVVATPTYISTRVPAFSQVSTYNLKTISYTATIPPPPVVPIEEDSTHAIDGLEHYGDMLVTSITTADGNITTTTLGKVWTLKVTVSNATNVGITFAPLSLSPSAEMYVFDANESILADSITRASFKDTSAVSMPPIPGNTLIIYIIEKGNTGVFKSTVHINQVIAGYQSVPVAGMSADVLKEGSVATNSISPFTIGGSPSVDCDPSIQCQPLKLPQGRAVGRMLNGGFLSTGTLINNELINGRSYFLVAWHAVDLNKDNTIDATELATLKTAVFSFKYWKPTCTALTTDLQSYYGGATVVASYRFADCAVLELIQGPGIGDGASYAGWNRLDQPANSGPYVIEHPQGADMRIATVKKVGTYFWNSHFWEAHFSSGAIGEGASGSALFNEYDEIVGQHKLGWSNCNYTDFGANFGKFEDSWTGIKSVISPTINLTRQSGLYTSTLSISGLATLSCGTSTTYSIPNFYGCTFLWTVGSNLTITAGQGTATVTVNANAGNLTSNVRVLITDSKGMIKTLTLNKPITLSTAGPTAATITSVSVAPYPNTQIDVHVTIPSGSTASSYKFYVDNVVVKSSTGLPAATTTLNGGGCGSHNVYLQLINNCGSTNSNTYPYTRSCSMLKFSVTPNPASSTLTIQPLDLNAEILSNTGSISQPESKASANQIQFIELFNSIGQLKLRKEFSGKLGNYSINISKFTSGTYFLKISDGVNLETHTVIIEQP